MSSKLTGLPDLSHPIELLVLLPGHKVELRVSSFELGQIEILPGGAAARETVPALRLFATRVDRHSNARYFDVTSTALQAALLPFLQILDIGESKFTITARGAMNRKTYTVEVTP